MCSRKAKEFEKLGEIAKVRSYNKMADLFGNGLLSAHATLEPASTRGTRGRARGVARSNLRPARRLARSRAHAVARAMSAQTARLSDHRAAAPRVLEDGEESE